MIGWLKARKVLHRLVDAEADELMHEHGDQALEVARSAMRLARERGDEKLAGLLSKVRARIEKRSGFVTGDTATRYLTDSRIDDTL